MDIDVNDAHRLKHRPVGRQAFAAVAVLALALSVFAIVGIAAYADAPNVQCKAYILVDARSGAVLAEKNADESLVPASLTKLMTLYLTLESVHARDVQWDDRFTISAYSNRISRQPSLSAFQLPTGKEYTVRELFYMAALNSSNAAAIALAEGLAGSETAFVARMDAKAVAFGLTDVRFANSSGLNNSDLFGNHPAGTAKNQDTKLSARSMAAIAYRLVNDYPEYIEYSALPQKIIREGQPDQIIVNTTNGLLTSRPYEMLGAKGLKTGHTANAGYCFAGYADRGREKMLSVVLGAPTTEERFRGSSRLLEYGFALAAARAEADAGIDLVALGYLFPDQLSYFTGRAGSLLAYGDTGFGVMRNGKMDMLAVSGVLYSVSSRGKAMRLDDGSGVGVAAMTYFNRDETASLPNVRTLAELEDALAALIDVDVASYCFRIESPFTPTRFSTASAQGAASAAPMSGSAGAMESMGVIVGFWNHQRANSVLREGFTFYYIDSRRTAGGLLEDALFDGATVAIDRMDPLVAAYGAGHSFKLQ